MTSEKHYIRECYYEAKGILNDLLGQNMVKFTAYRANEGDMLELYFTKWGGEEVKISGGYFSRDRDYIDVIKTFHPDMIPLYRQNGEYKPHQKKRDKLVNVSLIEEYNVLFCDSNGKLKMTISAQANKVSCPLITQVTYIEFNKDIVAKGYVNCTPQTAIKLASDRYPQILDMYCTESKEE